MSEDLIGGGKGVSFFEDIVSGKGERAEFAITRDLVSLIMYAHPLPIQAEYSAYRYHSMCETFTGTWLRLDAKQQVCIARTLIMKLDRCANTLYDNPGQLEQDVNDALSTCGILVSTSRSPI